MAPDYIKLLYQDYTIYWIILSHITEFPSVILCYCSTDSISAHLHVLLLIYSFMVVLNGLYGTAFTSEIIINSMFILINYYSIKVTYQITEWINEMLHYIQEAFNSKENCVCPKVTWSLKMYSVVSWGLDLRINKL